MAIIENSRLTGGGTTNTLTGNIVFDEALGELRQTKLINGVPVVVFRMNADGIQYYNDDGNLLQRISPSGIEYYNGSEELLQRITATGTEFYDADGNLQHKIDATGDHYYDDNETERLVTGIDSRGYMRMLFKSSDGTPRTLIGQSPKDGEQVVAVSLDDTVDVETELLA